MNTSWCPISYLNELINIGEVKIIDEDIYFNYKGLNLVFKAKDEIEIFFEVFFRQEYNVLMDKETIVMDIGANVGISTLYFALNKNVSKVYSYEPFEFTYECFINNLNQNPYLAQKVYPNNFGLGSSDRIARGVTNYVFKGNSKVTDLQEIPPESASHPGTYFFEEIDIRRTSNILKEIIENHEECDIVIKMDCEGGEEEIFNDTEFINLLDNVKAIVMETHTPPLFNSIYNTLKSKGFKVDGGMLSFSNGYIKATK